MSLLSLLEVGHQKYVYLQSYKTTLLIILGVVRVAPASNCFEPHR